VPFVLHFAYRYRVSAGWEVHDNAVFSETGQCTVCGKDLKDYVAEGHDHGSTVAKWPADAALVAMGKKVLGMSA